MGMFVDCARGCRRPSTPLAPSADCSRCPEYLTPCHSQVSHFRYCTRSDHRQSRKDCGKMQYRGFAACAAWAAGCIGWEVSSAGSRTAFSASFAWGQPRRLWPTSPHIEHLLGLPAAASERCKRPSSDRAYMRRIPRAIRLRQVASFLTSSSAICLHARCQCGYLSL